jgi:RNA polymerase sigma-70 factor (family 1)
MVRKMNESEIILGLKGGDQRAFNALFDLFYTRLQHFAQGLTGDTQEGEDIVIRTFHTFWNIRERFETLINIKAFFYISVRNSSLNYLKSKQRTADHQAEYKEQMPEPTEQRNAERKLIEAELLNLLHEKVEKLPKKCREIFKLTYFEDLKAGEIARRLNIKPITVTTQRARAIKILKEMISEKEFLLVLVLLSCLSK